MAYGYIERGNTYKVRWQETVTYEKEVEADNEEEAQDIAQENYGRDDEIDCEYQDGTMQILFMKEGGSEPDPDYYYKESLDNLC